MFYHSDEVETRDHNFGYQTHIFELNNIKHTLMGRKNFVFGG